MAIKLSDQTFWELFEAVNETPLGQYCDVEASWWDRLACASHPD